MQRQLTDSERDWLESRTYLRDHRHELGNLAVEEFPDVMRVADTPLLAAPGWLPDKPLPLEAIDLEFVADAPYNTISAAAARSVLPIRATGERYRSYSQAIGEIAAPAVFEDRVTYRLVEADLSGSRGRFAFSCGTYFDGIDTGEAAAHEFATSRMGNPTREGIRERIGDPCDPRRRPVNVAISTVTVRRDPTTAEATFLLHWRDPCKVGHAGGLYQVVPVGVFQPSGKANWNTHNDFSLWRNIVRELAEELLGESEDYDSETAPIDYEAWPFAARLDQARAEGQLRAYCLGLGVDPLTYATDLLTAVVIDAPIFDELFGDVVTDNAEGQVLDAQPFTAEDVERLTDKYPMQAAGAALLQLATTSDLV